MHRSGASDHYATLGLPRAATGPEIKRAYRELAKRCHPDIDPSPLANARFMAVHAAYATLSDPLLRIAYDAQLAVRERHHAPPPLRRAQDGSPRYRQRERSGPDIRTRSWPFIGLHLTGLVFGVLLVSSILAGIAFDGWSWTCFPFITPGLMVIPDAWSGLMMAYRRAHSKRWPG